MQNKFFAVFLFAALIYTSVFSQIDSSRIFVLLTNGGPPNNRYKNAELVVNKRWGIYYKEIASGCLVTQEMEDSMKIFNSNVYPLIAAVYGKNWETKHSADIKSEMAVQEEIVKLLERQKYIKTKRKAKVYLEYFMKPAETKESYYVTVWGVDKINEKVGPVTYYKLFVELLNKNIRVDSDKREPFNGSAE